MRAVLFPRQLLLDKVVLYPDETLKSATVTNGGWFLKRQNGEFWACYTANAKKPVTFWSDKVHQLVIVPETVEGNDLAIVEWAIQEIQKRGDCPYHLSGWARHFYNQG